jgi:ATP-dependent DNA ligase
MAPTLVRAPFHRPGWIYEEKVDGYRMPAYKDGARVRLVSRNGVDHTRRYPDVAAAFTQLKPSTLVLDGELAVFDDQLRSRHLPGAIARLYHRQLRTTLARKVLSPVYRRFTDGFKAPTVAAAKALLESFG